jgi:purine-binding chemotaxis protein CheW
MNPMKPQIKNQPDVELPKHTSAQEVIESVAEKGRKQEEKIVPTEQMVTFKLDEEEYASSITDLREIIKIPEIVPIPGAPDFINGILNLRGQIVVVVDLEKRFHLKRERTFESQHIIIAEVEENTFGVIVDEVTGVLRVPISNIKSTPQLVASKIHAEYLRGVVVLEEVSSPETTDTEVIKEDINTGKKDATTQKSSDQTPKVNKNTEKNISDMVKSPTIQKKSETTSRLLLLLDIPKMLAEKELLEFSGSIQETVNKNS